MRRPAAPTPSPTRSPPPRRRSPRLSTAHYAVLANDRNGEAGMSVTGLTTQASRFGPDETMERLEAAVKAKGMTIFARIDHAAGAKEVGLELRPTAVLIFGNARGGTLPMRTAQTLGIDL